jgi:hypothetical protein
MRLLAAWKRREADPAVGLTSTRIAMPCPAGAASVIDPVANPIGLIPLG